MLNLAMMKILGPDKPSYLNNCDYKHFVFKNISVPNATYVNLRCLPTSIYIYLYILDSYTFVYYLIEHMLFQLKMNHLITSLLLI